MTQAPASLEPTTAFVTGIGRGIATALLERGARVIACDQDGRRLESLVANWPERSLPWQLDVGDRQAVAGLPSALGPGWSGVDVVVNCAGHDVGGRRPFHEADMDQYAGIIDTNVVGLMRISHAFAPGMVERGRGHIVNLGSYLGIRTVATASAYAASKHAVHGLSETLRLDFAGTGVRVTEICPGRVRTNFALARAGNQADADAFYDQVGDCLSPADIAAAVLYALEQPPHVVVSQLVIMPASQSA